MSIASARVYGNSHPPKATPNPIGAGSNIPAVLYEVINVTTAPVATNTLDFGYLPAGAIPIGGYVSMGDMDTGTEVLDFDLGITDNGVDGADPDFFMNGGVFSGDPITDLPLTNAANLRILTGPFPITQLSAKTLVQGIFNVAANVFAAAKITVCIYYIVPGKTTS